MKPSMIHHQTESEEPEKNSEVIKTNGALSYNEEKKLREQLSITFEDEKDWKAKAYQLLPDLADFSKHTTKNKNEKLSSKSNIKKLFYRMLSLPWTAILLVCVALGIIIIFIVLIAQ